MSYIRPPGAATDFSFTGISYTRPTGSAVDFSFVSESTGDLVEVNVTGRFAKLKVRARIAPVRKLNVTGSFAKLSVRATAQYKTNTARPLVNHTTSRHQQSAGVQNGVSLDHQEASQLHTGWASHHTYAKHSSAWVESTTPQIFRRVKDLFLSHHQAGTNIRAGLDVWHQDADRTLRLMLNSAFEAASLARASTNFRHQDGTKRRAEKRGLHQEASLTGRWIVTSAQLAIPMSRTWYAEHEEAMRPIPGLSYPPIKPLPEPEFTCYTPDGKLLFESPWDGSGFLLFRCDDGSTPPPGPGGEIIVPVRRVYIVINDIQIKRVDGSIPLPTYTFALSLDADSWTWTWSATMHASAQPNLEPAKAGEPVEIEALINGVPYRLMIESVRRNRQFAQTRLDVSGRGLSAALDAPYAASITHSNAAGARTAQQLMGDSLMINGVPIGWSVDFGLTDWLVPAGAWLFDGTHIAAINQIAQAAGGYVQPHPTAKTLRILPRYPLAPWDWGDVVPDISLPIDPVSVEGVEWVSKPAYTRVFVSGEGQGILGQVTKGGTAGDLIAPMVTDPLITHADAARQRGISILSDTGPQALVSLRMPVLPETGLILPGRFIRRTDGAEVLQGLVRSMSLSWDSPRLRQTIEVQTHG